MAHHQQPAPPQIDPVERRLVCMGKRIRVTSHPEDPVALAVDNLHAVTESCGRSITAILSTCPDGYDKGRLIAALDELEKCKNAAIQAIHLCQK
jgi:hypothetical protein